MCFCFIRSHFVYVTLSLGNGVIVFYSILTLHFAAGLYRGTGPCQATLVAFRPILQDVCLNKAYSIHFNSVKRNAIYVKYIFDTSLQTKKLIWSLHVVFHILPVHSFTNIPSADFFVFALRNRWFQSHIPVELKVTTHVVRLVVVTFLLSRQDSKYKHPNQNCAGSSS